MNLVFPLAATLLLAAAALAADETYLWEPFTDGWLDRWRHSASTHYKGRFRSFQPANWTEQGIRVHSKKQHYGLTYVLPEALDVTRGLVFQYEVKLPQNFTCGGTYMKLLSHQPDFRSDQLTRETPYSIMFGPDRCGLQAQVHLILRHTNPVTGKTSEHHLQSAPEPPEDPATHVYTLILTKDNYFRVLIDGFVASKGNLLDKGAFDPPLQPPRTIPDPSDIKPEDWEEDATIVDQDARKPPGWDDRRQVPDEEAAKPEEWHEDEPLKVPDTSATPPEGWDEEEDGEWEPPLIDNPKCTLGCGPWPIPLKRNPNYAGVWMPPLIPNPKYKGPWVQRQIANPEWFEEKAPLAHVPAIGAVAVEIWAVDRGAVFDSVYLGSSDRGAAEKRDSVWRPKYDAEVSARKAVLRDTYRPLGTSAMLARLIIQAFDRPPLVWAKPQAGPLLDALKAQPLLAWAVLLAPVVAAAAAGAVARRAEGRQGRGKGGQAGAGQEVEEETQDPDAAAAVAEAEAAVAAARAEEAVARAARAAAAKAAAAGGGHGAGAGSEEISAAEGEDDAVRQGGGGGTGGEGVTARA